MKDIIVYSYENNDYFIGYQIAELLGYKDTNRIIRNNISDENKIIFKNYLGIKEPKIGASSVLITRNGIYDLLSKIKKALTQDTLEIFDKLNIDTSNNKVLKEDTDEESDIEKTDPNTLIKYSYISNRIFYEYFIGYQITSKLDYKNITQALENVSKCNKLIFSDYPGPKHPKIDPKTILITRDGAIELVIKTRKRVTPEVLHLFKQFGIDTTNRKCLTKEQQTLSPIGNVFKTEKIEDQFKVDKYYLDMYFPEYKIIIECDENGHSDRKPGDERERMDIVNEILNIDDSYWIRYNPDEYDFDISKVIGRIYRKIDEIKEKKYKEEFSKVETILPCKTLLKFTKEDIEFEVHSGKMKAPPKAFLVQELERGNSMLKIGQNLGISSKPVVKWLKEYNLNINDYKNNYEAPPKDELIKLFETKNQTEVADYYCQSTHIVRKWLKFYDINLDELKSKNKVEINKESLLNLINENIDEKEIAKRLNITELQLSKYIKMHNITRIPTKEDLEKVLRTKNKEDVAKHYNTTRTTLRKWVNIYDLGHIRFTTKTHKPIKVIKDNVETEYDSIKDLCKDLKIGKNKVHEYVDTDNEYNGYKFKFITDF